MGTYYIHWVYVISLEVSLGYTTKLLFNRLGPVLFIVFKLIIKLEKFRKKYNIMHILLKQKKLQVAWKIESKRIIIFRFELNN